MTDFKWLLLYFPTPVPPPNASRFGPFPVRPLSRSASYPFGPVSIHRAGQVIVGGGRTGQHAMSPTTPLNFDFDHAKSKSKFRGVVGDMACWPVRPSPTITCPALWVWVHKCANSKYIQTVIMIGLFVFFQDLCEFVIHCNKRHIFLCLFVLLAHYYWWKWRHYCRIEKVIFFEWHFYHLFRGFPSLDFSQLWKMVPALAFNSIIVAASAWRGKWNRHAVVHSDKKITEVPF